MNKKFIKDYKRFTKDKYSYIRQLLRRLKNHELQYIYLGRKLEHSRCKIARFFYSLRLSSYRKKYGLEMNFKNIGGGLRLVHPWCITVNDNAVLGQNVTLYKGVTVGVITGGEKAGCPTIGDNVTICANATVCGNVKIGDNTMIASGAFVNFDVPPDSLVIGNPGQIKSKKHE